MTRKMSDGRGSCLVSVATALIGAVATIVVAVLTNPTVLDRILPAHPGFTSSITNQEALPAPVEQFPASPEVEVAPTPTPAEPEPSPSEEPAADLCIDGYVWRDAFPGDHVCVTPEMRDQVAADNALVETRKDPAGMFGPDSCISGYVWRVAVPEDLVCVTPEMRDQVAVDNALAGERLLNR
ncbi:MAG TPA: hypothetical protein VGD69_26630 [Herpetosiphonaceae bacterium]